MKKIILLCLLLTGIIIHLSFAQDSEKEMVILPDGNVGIGTETPSEKLEVAGNIKCAGDMEIEGRVKDATGFVMPVGSILPFAGDKNSVPEGWLLCDGTAYSSENYPELYSVIRENYGDGSVTTNEDGSTGPATVDTSVPGNPVQCDFNVPDLRGQFLRGVDDGSGNDPDADSRGESKDGSNTGNNVGSGQADALQEHQHDSRVTANNAMRRSVTNDGSDGHSNRTIDGDPGYATIAISVDNAKNATVAQETRPKNVYVNFIIKY